MSAWRSERQVGCADLGRPIIDTNGAGDYARGCAGTHEEFPSEAQLRQHFGTI